MPLCAAVDLVQAPRTRLADIDLPDLEDAVLGGGARGGAAAASDIERAAAQIERAAEQLQRLAASKELSQAQVRISEVYLVRQSERHAKFDTGWKLSELHILTRVFYVKATVHRKGSSLFWPSHPL